MDTLIKGLETPKSCYSEIYSEQGNCWFFFYDFKGGCHCSISDCKCLKTKRPKGCPLVEVPPHGELVQRSDILRLFDENKLSAREAVMKAPTILEATE